MVLFDFFSMIHVILALFWGVILKPSQCTRLQTKKGGKASKNVKHKKF